MKVENLETPDGFMTLGTSWEEGGIHVRNSLHYQSRHLLIFSDVSEQNAHCANLFLSG